MRRPAFDFRHGLRRERKRAAKFAWAWQPKVPQVGQREVRRSPFAAPLYGSRISSPAFHRPPQRPSRPGPSPEPDERGESRRCSRGGPRCSPRVSPVTVRQRRRNSAMRRVDAGAGVRHNGVFDHKVLGTHDRKNGLEVTRASSRAYAVDQLGEHLQTAFQSPLTLFVLADGFFHQSAAPSCSPTISPAFGLAVAVAEEDGAVNALGQAPCEGRG